MFAALIVILSFAAGIGLRWRASALLGPLAGVVYGAALVEAERPTYDMHGFGYVDGAIVALAALLVWGLGRWIRHLAPANGHRQ